MTAKIKNASLLVQFCMFLYYLFGIFVSYTVELKWVRYAIMVHLYAKRKKLKEKKRIALLS